MLSDHAFKCKQGWWLRCLMQTPLLISSECKLVSIVRLDLRNKNSEECTETRSPQASLSFKGQTIERTTAKWSIITKFVFLYLKRTESVSSKSHSPISYLKFLQALSTCKTWRECLKYKIFLLPNTDNSLKH